MREIKFRVWDNVDYMSTPFTLKYVMDMKIQWTSECVVMQYTGLKDKNGVEIYEGDIIKTKWNNIHKVEWIDSSCGFEPFSDSNENCGHCGGGLNPVEVEVIGNIYEHPNLFKQ